MPYRHEAANCASSPDAWVVVADNQIGVWFYVLVHCRGFLECFASPRGVLPLLFHFGRQPSPPAETTVRRTPHTSPFRLRYGTRSRAHNHAVELSGKVEFNDHTILMTGKLHRPLRVTVSECGREGSSFIISNTKEVLRLCSTRNRVNKKIASRLFLIIFYSSKL